MNVFVFRMLRCARLGHYVVNVLDVTLFKSLRCLINLIKFVQIFNVSC